MSLKKRFHDPKSKYNGIFRHSPFASDCVKHAFTTPDKPFPSASLIWRSWCVKFPPDRSLQDIAGAWPFHLCKLVKASFAVFKKLVPPSEHKPDGLLQRALNIWVPLTQRLTSRERWIYKFNMHCTCCQVNTQNDFFSIKWQLLTKDGPKKSTLVMVNGRDWQRKLPKSIFPFNGVSLCSFLIPRIR